MRPLLVIVTLLIARDAIADEAADLAKQGLDEYRAGNYSDAAKTLARAYELDKKPDTLFSLAQAERLNGDCKSAVPHYKTVIEQVADFNVAKLVQQNLTLCDGQEPQTAPIDTRPAEPTVVTKTVEVNRTDTLGVVLLGGGGIALGVAAGLFVASSGTRDAADRARTFEDHQTLSDRARTQRGGAYIAGGAGIAMIGFAVFRFATASKGSTSDVAIVPTAQGAELWFARSF